MNKFKKKLYDYLIDNKRYCSLDSLFGGGDSGSQAAAPVQQYNQEAIEELKKQFATTTANLKPYMQAGRSALPQVTQGTSARGLDARLAEIFNTDIFKSLVDERGRAVEGQLAAGGLTRSGTALQEAARVPTDIGLMIEQLLTGRSTNLANNGQNAAANLGSIGANNSNAIANLLNGTGMAQSNGIITDAQADASGAQNALNTAITVGSLFFSDPSIKHNIEHVGNVHNLKLCQWDWKPETEGTLIADCGTLGFMADEVAEKYPHHVAEFCGFMVIDYPNLLNELEMKEAA